MQFRILKAHGADADAWHRLIHQLPPGARDIHFLPEYGRIYRDIYGHEPWLAVYGDDARFVVQPFVRRPLNELPFLRETGNTEAWFEIANPYGYGGPVASACNWDERTALMRGFEQGLLDYCRSQRFASEFSSIHPRLGGTELLARCTTLTPFALKKVVYIDLTASREERWRDLRKGHKSSVKKALRAGITIERVEASAANLDELKRLYYQTMDRNGAQERWYLPQDYFDCCIAHLGAHRASLFVARKGSATAAASLLMHDFDTAYYHFSGSDARFSEYGAGTLMVFEMAQWAAEAGYRSFHLGGGVTAAEDDSLFRFKSGFSAGFARLHGCSRVLDSTTYERLCALKVAHEIRTAGAPSDSDYFPLYRR